MVGASLNTLSDQADVEFYVEQTRELAAGIATVPSR